MVYACYSACQNGAHLKEGGRVDREAEVPERVVDLQRGGVGGAVRAVGDAGRPARQRRDASVGRGAVTSEAVFLDQDGERRRQAAACGGALTEEGREATQLRVCLFARRRERTHLRTRKLYMRARPRRRGGRWRKEPHAAAVKGD